MLYVGNYEVVNKRSMFGWLACSSKLLLVDAVTTQCVKHIVLHWRPFKSRFTRVKTILTSPYTILTSPIPQFHAQAVLRSTEVTIFFYINVTVAQYCIVFVQWKVIFSNKQWFAGYLLLFASSILYIVAICFFRKVAWLWNNYFNLASHHLKLDKEDKTIFQKMALWKEM